MSFYIETHEDQCMPSKEFEPSDRSAYMAAIKEKDPAELDILSKHPCRFVRARVAANEALLPATHDRLLRDKEPMVIANAVSHKLCTQQLAEAVATWMIHSNENEHIVWYTLLARHVLPEWLKELLLLKTAMRLHAIREKCGTAPKTQEDTSQPAL